MSEASGNSLRLPIQLSILAALATMALKTTAWLLTGSVGLLSDAAESLVNLVAALIAFFALRYAAQPADREHAYGHEKIEYFSSGVEGGLIFMAGVIIAWSAVEHLIHGHELKQLDLGLLLAVVAAVINLVVARILIRVGRRYRSIILEADGQHLMTDVYTSVAVLAGLALVAWTGAVWIDPVIALLVAAQITFTAGSLVRRSFDGLMDRALPEAELQRLRNAITAHLEQGMTFHALRTRQAGSRTFADFHLLVPGTMSVVSAHAEAHRIEAALRLEWSHLEITVHVEPIEERESYEDNALLELEERQPD